MSELFAHTQAHRQRYCVGQWTLCTSIVLTDKKSKRVKKENRQSYRQQAEKTVTQKQKKSTFSTRRDVQASKETFIQ
jgi:hypothetical protein